MSQLDDGLKSCDSFYDAGDLEKAYNVAKELFEACDENKTDIMVLWRLARGCRDMANAKGASDKKAYEGFIKDGYEHINNALIKCKENDLKNPDVHKWYGIFLDLYSRLNSMKERIKNSFIVLEHLQLADQIRPNDFPTLHSLGVWHFEVSNLSFAQRTVASVLFATPPTSKFEEALKYLDKAEELKPGYFASNGIYLAKTYYQLNKCAEAKKFCQVVLANTSQDLDAIESREEAQALMKKVGKY